MVPVTVFEKVRKTPSILWCVWMKGKMGKSDT